MKNIPKEQNSTLYDWVSESQLTTTVDGVQVTATWLVSGHTSLKGRSAQKV